MVGATTYASTPPLPARWQNIYLVRFLSFALYLVRTPTNTAGTHLSAASGPKSGWAKAGGGSAGTALQAEGTTASLNVGLDAV